MRLLLIALLTAPSFGCSDDDNDDRASVDAGSDAATDGARDADVPALDARAADGSDEDASNLSDAGDAGACLEASYIWSLLEECFEEPSQLIARRVTLSEFCADYDCPADWNAALAAAAECNEDAGADADACWAATMECGADLLTGINGPNGRFLYYDPATGELIGAALQLTDVADECTVSEIIAGERPPICCGASDAGDEP